MLYCMTEFLRANYIVTITLIKQKQGVWYELNKSHLNRWYLITNRMTWLICLTSSVHVKLKNFINKQSFLLSLNLLISIYPTKCENFIFQDILTSWPQYLLLNLLISRATITQWEHFINKHLSRDDNLTTIWVIGFAKF